MNTTRLHLIIDAANPHRRANAAQVDRIMTAIRTAEINRSSRRIMNVNQFKEHIIKQLHTLPAVAIVAVAAILGLGGITYATVKTVQNWLPTLTNSSQSTTGRTELTMQNARCNTGEANDTRHYELRRGSTLTAEEGVKVVQARCELEKLEPLVRQDLGDKYTRILVFGQPASTGTVTAVDDTRMTISGILYDLRLGSKPFTTQFSLTPGVKYYTDATRSDKSSVKIGDRVLLYTEFGDDHSVLAVIRLALDGKYYNSTLTEMISEFAPCDQNPTFTCLEQGSNTIVNVARGGYNGGPIDPNHRPATLSGKLVEHDATHFTIESTGLQVRFNTNSDIIAQYDTAIAPTLPSLDPAYADTPTANFQPTNGDWIEVHYFGPVAGPVPWAQLLGVRLLVDRDTNTNIIRKY